MSQANKIIDTNNFRVGWGSGNWFKKYLVSRLASKNYILLLCFVFFKIDKERVGQRVN
jgi:hypothetical protein